MGNDLLEPFMSLVTPLRLRDEVADPSGAWPEAVCAVTSAGAELPPRKWCAVMARASQLTGATSNTNLLKLKIQYLVCCINQLFTFIKGQRSGTVLFS